MLQKALSLKLTEALNVSILVSSFLNFVYLGVLQALGFGFIALNLVEKAVLHVFSNILDYIKKNISLQFHYCKFSQQRYSTLSYYYRRVTRERRKGCLKGRSPIPFLKNWKKCPNVLNLWVKFLV